MANEGCKIGEIPYKGECRYFKNKRGMNIYRQAKHLLDTKKGSEMSEGEFDLVSQAIVPLLILRAFNDITIGEGLEVLAKILEEIDA